MLIKLIVVLILFLEDCIIIIIITMKGTIYIELKYNVIIFNVSFVIYNINFR